MKRPAAALARIAFEPEDDKVVYTAPFNPRLRTDRIEVDPLEFLATALMHVPDRNSPRVMGCGASSSRGLGERRRARRGSKANGGATLVVAHEPETDADAFARKRRQSWARLIPGARADRGSPQPHGRPRGRAVAGRCAPARRSPRHFPQETDRTALIRISPGSDSAPLPNPRPVADASRAPGAQPVGQRCRLHLSAPIESPALRGRAAGGFSCRSRSAQSLVL